MTNVEMNPLINNVDNVVDHIAELAYLTSDDGRAIFNLQIEGMFTRVEINRAQLRGILIEGVGMVCGEQGA